ncbi:TDT family transporter [Millisia brevis]|uniref:TDT family transporter n=1 Tax=Millisia brevis TaxID=264148 RepID=UPI0008371741|nr:TDT family transporter [Millisia brevis]
MTTIDRSTRRIGGVPASDGPLRPARDATGRLRFVGPNWFATVMGTGIVAVVMTVVPVTVPGLLVAARGMWVLAALLLVVVTAATAAHWVRYPRVARGHVDDPVLAHFYGAPAMAALTVGAGAGLVAGPLIGETPARLTAGVLWLIGTALGLWVAVAIPLRAFTTHRISEDAAGGPWLMSVVAPMVSAATGAALIPDLPAGQWQLTMLLACWAMFGLTVIASLIIVTLIWHRLLHHKVGPAVLVPTLWIPLGPVGQSITAAHHLGNESARILPAPYGDAFRAFGLVYGLPMFGFGLFWLAIAVTLTIRARRDGLPFALTWWSFTFPVGTMTTGASALATTTGATVLTVIAAALGVALVGAWAGVARRTLAGALDGSLLMAPIGTRKAL